MGFRIVDLQGASLPLTGDEFVELEQAGNSRRVRVAELIPGYDGESLASSLANDDDTSKGVALVGRSVVRVNTMAQLRTIAGRADGDAANLVSYYGGWESTSRGPVGGGNFHWDAGSTETDDGGTVIAVDGVATGRWKRKFDGSTVHIEWFGAVNDTDAVPQLQAARDYLTSIGGGVIRASGRYLLDSGNLEIDADNIWVIGYGPGKTIFERTSTQNGFAFWWARNSATNGGGLAHCELVGLPTNASGNGGVAFGYDNDPTFNKANGWLLMNVVARRWSQYGVGINSGDNWLARDVRVLEHGITSDYMASCMGFYVYPKSASSNGKLYNIHSVINPDSQAIANNAAIKIQTHQNLMGEMIFGKGGSEQCIGFDSFSGTVRNVVARANSAAPGVVLGNYNPAHAFRGEFTIDGLDCEDAFSVSLVIGSLASTDTEPKLKNCTIRNVEASTFRVNSYSAWQDCLFDNVKCSAFFRLEHALAGVSLPNVAITGNTYRNCSGSSFDVRGDSGKFYDCAATSGALTIVGNGNTLDGPKSIGSGGNGLVVEGSNNALTNLLSKSAVGRKIWIKSGDANVFHGVTIGGTAILNSGTNTNTTNVAQI